MIHVILKLLLEILKYSLYRAHVEHYRKMQPPTASASLQQRRPPPKMHFLPQHALPTALSHETVFIITCLRCLIKLLDETIAKYK